MSDPRRPVEMDVRSVRSIGVPPPTQLGPAEVTVGATRPAPAQIAVPVVVPPPKRHLLAKTFGVSLGLFAVGAIGVSILTSFAFAAPIVAFSVTQKSDQGFSFIFRLIITPLAFFSGTYFPIENLPFAAQILAWCTPLAHAVALNRASVLGTELTAVGFHVAALLAWGIAGTIAAIYLFRKRMLK